jgi:acyl-CoA thioester hydrolase
MSKIEKPNYRHQGIPMSDPAVLKKSGTLHVDPEWIDLYGHMTAYRYVATFDTLGFALLGELGVGEDYTKRTGCGIYTADLRVTYVREVFAGDPLEVRLFMLDSDEKRVLCVMELWQIRDNYLSAIAEQLSIHVDLSTRKVLPFPEATERQLQEAVEAHAPLVPATYERKLRMLRN